MLTYKVKYFMFILIRNLYIPHRELKRDFQHVCDF